MATLFSLIGANFDALLAGHASSIEAGDKARSEFRGQAQTDFETAEKSFLSDRDAVRTAADLSNKSESESALDSFKSTRDAIVDASENGNVDTITDFVAELEENQEEINKLIASHTLSHEAAIADILADLGTEADFGTGYGDDLPGYTPPSY